MSDLKSRYLFKKKKIHYPDKEYEIFELIDYVARICFTNKDNIEACNVINEKHCGIYANIIRGDKKEGEFVFVRTPLESAIKENDNRIDFMKIRQKQISCCTQYYIRNNNNKELTALSNPDLISYLQQKEQSDFHETTNISWMYHTIKKTIIAQEEQIMQILTTLFKNQTVVNSNLELDFISKLKENILIYGPTGTGKTEILKRIALLYKIPIVIEDATSLSETGYQGRNITDMLENLCLVANNNIELAEKGILVIDEFDKLAEKSGDTQSHVSRLGVQRSLLKLLDGTTFYFHDKKFDTSKLTIVAIGAFTGITNQENYKNLTTDDFVKFGIMRETIGRFSKMVPMNPLKKEDMIRILKESDFSPLYTYKKLFELLNVQFTFNDDFIEYIVQLALLKQSGARSLKTVFDNCISSALFQIFAGEYGSISLVGPTQEFDKPYILSKRR